MSYSKQAWDTTSYVNPTRMNHIEDGIDNALPKDTGGTINGNVQVDARLDVGGTSRGEIRVYGNNPSYYGRFYNSGTDALTANRTYYLPNKDGTIAFEKGSVSREYTNKTWAEILADFWGSRIDKSRITPTSVLCVSINNDDNIYTISATNAVRGITPTYAYFIRSLVATGRNEAIYMDTTSSYNFYKKYVYNGNLDTDYTSTTVSSVTLTLYY